MAARPSIQIDRLFAAADALLAAIESSEGMNTLIEVSFDDPHAVASVTGRVFTHSELIEAMAMLIRLGLVSDH